MGAFFKQKMMVSDRDVLREHKDRVAGLATFTSEGKILLTSGLTELPAALRISAYVIAKVACRIAGAVAEDSVANKELEVELGLPEGTVSRVLTELRQDHTMIQLEPGLHRVVYNRIPQLLDRIDSSYGSRK